jgi:membrane protein implicated in regulation of membrane protease activity
VRGGAKETKTNYNAMVGTTATVTQRISAASGLGVVTVLGEEWSALAETPRDIAVGEKVEVVGVTGVRLVVRALTLNTDQNKEGTR